MANVYILHSPSTDKYYVGSCHDLEERIEKHRSKEYSDSYTALIADDWAIFLHIDNLEYQQARTIEQHIKNMKSRQYIQNLKAYPEMVKKLVQKY